MYRVLSAVLGAEEHLEMNKDGSSKLQFQWRDRKIYRQLQNSGKEKAFWR